MRTTRTNSNYLKKLSQNTDITEINTPNEGSSLFQIKRSNSLKLSDYLYQSSQEQIRKRRGSINEYLQQKVQVINKKQNEKKNPFLEAKFKYIAESPSTTKNIKKCTLHCQDPQQIVCDNDKFTTFRIQSQKMRNKGENLIQQIRARMSLKKI